MAASVAVVMVAASSGAGYAGGGHHKHGPGPHHGDRISTVTDLSGPRGVESVRPGVTLVSEDDGSFSVVIERHRRRAKVVELGSLPGSAGFANAVSTSRGKVYIVTGEGAPDTGAASLYVWDWRRRHQAPQLLADIGAYQASDPDPSDLEDAPEDSNPYDVLALRDGTVLVADAAGNDLLRVWPSGNIKTVARLMPRTVEVPDGLPDTDPDGNPLPPAGTPIPAEAVATSVTVGSDGYWYVGELRGFPATPGTSQIWRIRPGSTNAVCDPEASTRSMHHSSCTKYADGLTSIVDLTADRHGGIYAVTLSKMSWLAMELGLPGADVGGLYQIRHHGHSIKELVKDKLSLPGGASVSKRGDIYVTGPVFGPGTLAKVSRR
ncbi:MAG: ScyD/ScyE family protein [Nocardioides sp.]|nr:ScyD/ScyE family protein [Nocardioides sp.]